MGFIFYFHENIMQNVNIFTSSNHGEKGVT